MPFGPLINAADLRQWADRQDARSRLPELVRRLVFATAPTATRVQFRSGEGIQLRGWDGLVTAQSATSFVPAGDSGWELGVDRPVLGKANSDYDKRSDDPDGLDPSAAAFVFVTARWFRDKARFEREKRASGRWREVRAFDSDDLATWLEQAPGVHVWISTELGKLPSGVRSLEEAWLSWSAASSPALPPALTIGGRGEAAATVAGWLTGTASVHVVRGDAAEEALAFVAAVPMTLTDEAKSSTAARLVVVDDPHAWRQLSRFPVPLILVPTFVPDDAAVAAASGHTVIIPVDRSVPAPGELDLPRVDRDSAATILEALGFERERARSLATQARRSLLGLRRSMAAGGVMPSPAWAAAGVGQDLVPAMLAGRWREDTPGDREMLGRLAGRTYDSWASSVAPWFEASDPPMRRDGAAVLLTSPESAWSLLSRHFSTPLLEAFRAVCADVLETVDPATTLPREDRWTAGFHGLMSPHSDLLRSGLAEALVRLATGGSIAGHDGQQQANLVVGRVLKRAGDEADERLWVSLKDVLPLLAEAAPNRFLDAVDRGLLGEPPPLAALINDSTDANSVTSPSPDHTGLLWALETIAWCPEFLARASLALARLASVDPGGRWANRPIGSLVHIFNPFLPQTGADSQSRMQVIDTIRGQVPAVAWSLLTGLLPTRGMFLTSTHRPLLRDWRTEDPQPVTYSQAFATIHGIVERLVKDAGTDGARLSVLASAFSELPPDSRELVLLAFEKYFPVPGADDATDALVDALRHTSSLHRRRPAASESGGVSDSDIGRLEAVMARLASDEPTRRHAWLFRHMPDLPEPRSADWAAYERELIDRRATAIDEVWRSGGLLGLIELGTRVEVPDLVGRAAAGLGVSEEEVSDLLAMLVAPDGRHSSIARGWVAARHAADGWPWSEAIMTAHSADWDAGMRATFLICHRAEERTWDWAERFGSETREAFWRAAWPRVIERGSLVRRAAVELLGVGRSHLALDLLALHRDDLVEEDLEIVLNVLEEAARTPPDPALGPPIEPWDVVRLLEFIDGSAGDDTSRLAGIEWLYLPILRYSERPATLLHAELARDPKFFVTVLTWMFKAEGEPPRQADEEQKVRARYGWELIDTWRRIPGLRDDGSLDAEALRIWVDSARSALKDADRAKIGDQRIGHMLRHAPAGTDGIWPAEPVRDLVEDLRSEQVEIGLGVEMRNSRGVTSRALPEGGAQERELARRLQEDASALSDRWPRTGSLLSRVAESYLDEARGHDQDAALTEDTW